MKLEKVTQLHKATLWIVLLIFTIGSRFFAIANKPIHFDESINGWFVLQMQTLGFYKYDPNNYHGPLFFYLVQFFELIWGRSLYILRSVPAVFSVFSVMVFTFGIMSSQKIERWIIFLFLTSPAFLFFGRSAIHEMPFVFFQILLFLGLSRWLEKADGTSISLGLLGLFGMMSLKETFTITLFCWLLALLSLGLQRVRDVFSLAKVRRAWTSQVSVFCVALAALFVLEFTGHMQNPKGFLDFFKAFIPWLKTGVHGTGHEKSIFYWLQVLVEAEPLVLLGVVAATVSLFSRTLELRMISVFSLSQLLIYSIIPYKTVWCVLTLVWGFYVVLAMILVRLWTFGRSLQVLLILVSLGSLIMGFYSSYRAVFRQPLDFSHPYIYVNSTPELQTLNDFLGQEARKNPNLGSAIFQVGMEEQWPWPWLLRSFKGLHYNLCRNTVIEGAAVYFCELPEERAVDKLLHEPYWKVHIAMRQGRSESVVYFKKALFPRTPFEQKAVSVGQGEELK